MKAGDWVAVKEEADIPAMFRNGPTIGRVEEIGDDCVMICVPIGDDHIDEHSQAVPYELKDLVPTETPEPYQ